MPTGSRLVDQERGNEPMSLVLELASAPFVPLWSSGIVAAKLAVPCAEPCTFLFLRFAIVTALLAPFVAAEIARTKPAALWHTAVAGASMQGFYSSLVVWSVYREMPAGVVALIVSMHPVTTALLARQVLRERISAWGRVGFGLGIVGTVLVLWPRLTVSLGAVPVGTIALCLAALPAMSAGTVYQRRLAPDVGPLTATCVQHMGALVVTGLGTTLLESHAIDWAPLMLASLAWQAIVVSIEAVALLLLMLARHGAARSASVFYLVPAGSTAMICGALAKELASVQLVGTVVMTGAVVLIGCKR
jgi:drug/metabolite transporter (DMT)-like permease